MNPIDDDTATVSGGGRHRRVELRRVVRAPIQQVWNAITDPEEVRQWWSKGELDAREGGRVQLEGEGDCDPDALPLDGRVKVCLPPHVFEFTWHEAYDPAMGLVRFDLMELDDETTLVTLVNLVPAADRLAASVGWHVLMDRLRERAAREPVSTPHQARMEELAALYDTP